MKPPQNWNDTLTNNGKYRGGISGLQFNWVV